MKCSDCNLDSRVLKDIELTGSYVSIQWAWWPFSTSHLSAKPQTQLGCVAWPACQCSRLAMWAATAGTESHWKCMPQRTDMLYQKYKLSQWQKIHALEKLQELLAILFLHFSSLVFTQLHLWVHFSATEIPLLSHSPFILSPTWLLTPSCAVSFFAYSSPRPLTPLSPRL